MRKVSKALLGIGAAASVAVTMAAPAEAQRYRYRDYDRGVDVGDVVAGIAIVGGVAAIISALDGNGRYGRGDYYGDNRYGRRGGSARQAVDLCARAARQEVRFGGDRARVGEIYDVDRAGNGYFRVRGTLNIRDYDRGYRGGYRVDNDRVGFQCTAGYGRVVDLDIGGRDFDRFGGYGRNDYGRYDRGYRW